MYLHKFVFYDLHLWKSCWMGKPFYTMFISILKHTQKNNRKLCKMLMFAVYFFVCCDFEYKSSSGTIQSMNNNNNNKNSNIETVTQLHEICLLMTNNKKQCEYIEKFGQWKNPLFKLWNEKLLMETERPEEECWLLTKLSIQIYIINAKWFFCEKYLVLH